jgi:hypothetical protein
MFFQYPDRQPHGAECQRTQQYSDAFLEGRCSKAFINSHTRSQHGNLLLRGTRGELDPSRRERLARRRRIQREGQEIIASISPAFTVGHARAIAPDEIRFF